MPKLTEFLLLTLLGLQAAAVFATGTGEPDDRFDERQMQVVDRNTSYQVVYDIRSSQTEAGVSRGLYYARGLYEAFRKAMSALSVGVNYPFDRHVECGG